MKTYTLAMILLTISFAGFNAASHASGNFNGPDSLTLGPGYANDVYFSFENGVVAEVPRANWDIAFHTTVWTATIITNGGSGVNLYVYPNADTAAWATADTAGMASWPVLYDNELSREDGAFNRNSPGHPDYGWGKYNMISHDVVGDSIYIIKTMSGNYKKLWILRKNSIANTYYLRYANLDGSDEQNVELAINPYRHMNFVHYNLSTGTLLEREPDTASWDILFTKYMAIQPNGTPYSVVGVLNNFKVYASEFYPVGPDFMDWTSQPMDSTLSPIGWEWKSFDMGTVTWTVADSTAFFVQARNKDIWKLVFTRFDGSSSGKIVFDRMAVSPSGIFDPVRATEEVRIYPNPVTDRMNLEFGQERSGSAVVQIFDLTGRLAYTTGAEIVKGALTIELNDVRLNSGLHVMKIIAGESVYSSRFMVYAR